MHLQQVRLLRGHLYSMFGAVLLAFAALAHDGAALATDYDVTINTSSLSSIFFNEFLQGTTLGTKISFQLDATTNGPTGASLPDTFSFFILNANASASLLTTTDPTGADSLLSLQIDGSPLGIHT